MSTNNSYIRFILVAIALILSMAMATTTTLAWFSLNQEAIVDDFNIQIGTDQGLTISVDQVNYYSTLTGDQIDGVYDRLYDSSENEFGFVLTPVRLKLNGNEYIMSGNDFTFEKINEARNHLNYATTPFFVDALPYDFDVTEEVPQVVGDYFAMTLYFRSDVDMDVYMSKALIESAVGMYATTGEAQTVPLPLIGTDMSSYTTDTAYLQGNKSFIDESNTLLADQRITAEAKNAMRLGISGLNTYVIDPNPAYGYNVGNFAQSYYNARGRYTTTDFQYMQDSYVVESDQVIKDGSYSTIRIVNLAYNESTGYYEGSIKVFIWLDGTDGDCFDSVKTDIVRTWMLFEGVLV